MEWGTKYNKSITYYITYEDGNIRVYGKSGPYGNSPFTVQSRGCGYPGEYIQVSAQMLQSVNLSNIFGPVGQTFVHEWAKYRYGIFEEFGYPGDDQYPMFYVNKTWTVYGEKNGISPNFCLNNIVKYSIENITGGTCQLDELTGLPGNDCIFVPGDTGSVESSIMALPYLDGNEYFCENESFYHDPMLPNKQNKLYMMQSTFSIINRHADFLAYTKNNTNTDEKCPTFNLLLPKTFSSYALVLDVSSNMDYFKRIDRMKDSVVRWIEYNFPNNAPLGIIKYSNNAEVLHDLIEITSEDKATIFSILRNLTATGGTCIHKALHIANEMLINGEEEHRGGVIIFVTTGYQNCEEKDALNITDIINESVKQQIRIVTISLGNEVDTEIIQLAEKTHGKAFFVPDNTGPEYINSAFQGSLAFLPSVAANQYELILAMKTFKNFIYSLLQFWIDETIGNFVDIQIDLSENVNCTIMLKNYTESFSTNGTRKVFQKKFDVHVTGKYFVKIFSSTRTRIEYASITITSTPKDETLPIIAHCWTSVGSKQADLTDNSTIVIMAQVLQGSNPVLKAKVRAFLDFNNSQSPLEVDLLDQGATPDILLLTMASMMWTEDNIIQKAGHYPSHHPVRFPFVVVTLLYRTNQCWYLQDHSVEFRLEKCYALQKQIKYCIHQVLLMI
jgi:uncharacterized protein YegL